MTDARAEFDIDAIADEVLGDFNDEVLGDFNDGFACMVDADRFWEITMARLIEH